MSTEDPFSTLEVLYVNDDGVVTCNLGCDDHEFLSRLQYRRNTLAEFHGALAEHLALHHPDIAMTLIAALPNALQQYSEDPAEQTEGNKVDARHHTERGDQKQDGSRDQQHQNDERHVDPLPHRGRW